ncbi:hypothetical protein BDP27DRAFT_1433222 [Rhodocollybia butyracea]|uniref:Nucleoplasmin-like domain-containing protein n=1 Tax=Rhodocollybia butyracea TaxID=206335 RepID=A0A9P5P7Q9_9AGAR|nr:hypothetical protein BDP27DRAFT_1433222 [Rhodocollybia butyracea]
MTTERWSVNIPPNSQIPLDTSLIPRNANSRLNILCVALVHKVVRTEFLTRTTVSIVSHDASSYQQPTVLCTLVPSFSEQLCVEFLLEPRELAYVRVEGPNVVNLSGTTITPLPERATVQFPEENNSFRLSPPTDHQHLGISNQRSRDGGSGPSHQGSNSFTLRISDSSHTSPNKRNYGLSEPHYTRDAITTTGERSKDHHSLPPQPDSRETQKHAKRKDRDFINNDQSLLKRIRR